MEFSTKLSPIKEDHGHPPTLSRYWDSLRGWSAWDDNGSGIDWQDIYNLIPDEKFSDENILDTLTKLNAGDFLPTLEEIRKEAEEWSDSVRHTISEKIQEEKIADFAGYRENGRGMEFLETLASLAGIPYFTAKSCGYSQGDHAETFGLITPEWIESTGCPPEEFENAMKEAARQYGAWAWGNVWFLAELFRPDGTEADTAELCCQHDIFGDPDDKKSGGMETLKEAAEMDAAEVLRERTEAEFWASRDSATIPA